mmetsp:Transcript_14348/g.36656  ORF Transcript_14348/g.36656 Transcript_14348/m.36656 type:complete len:280 (-) Transcript_14348:845-1684(-)
MILSTDIAPTGPPFARVWAMSPVRFSSMRTSVFVIILSAWLACALHNSMSSALAGTSMRSSRTFPTKSSNVSSRPSVTPRFIERLRRVFVSSLSIPEVDLSRAASCALLWPKSASLIWSRRCSISFGSTPMRSSRFRTSSLFLMCSHSSELTMPSCEVSAALKVSCSVERSSKANISSSSCFEVSSTTEHSTPISMFNSVMPEMIMKMIKAHISNRLSSLMACSVCARLSPSTPRVKSDIIEEPRSEKSSRPVGSAPSSGGGASRAWGPSSLVKRIAKT